MEEDVKAPTEQEKTESNNMSKTTADGPQPSGRSASVTVDAGIMLLTSQYDPDDILDALRELFEDLAKEERPAEAPRVGPDTSIVGKSISIIVEAKRANVTLPDRQYLSSQAISEDVERYAELATELFNKSLREELAEAAILILFKAVFSAIHARNKEGFLSPKKSSAELFKQVYARLAKLLADRVGAKRSGRKRKMTPAKEAVYASTYYKALADLQDVNNLIKKMMKSDVKVTFGDVMVKVPYPDVTTGMVKGLMSSDSPSDFAHKLAAIRLKIPYGPYLEDVIARHNNKK